MTSGLHIGNVKNRIQNTSSDHMTINIVIHQQVQDHHQGQGHVKQEESLVNTIIMQTADQNQDHTGPIKDQVDENLQIQNLGQIQVQGQGQLLDIVTEHIITVLIVSFLAMDTLINMVIHGNILNH